MRFVTVCHNAQGSSETNRHSTKSTMSTRGRSASPQSREMDVDMDKPASDSKPEPKVVVITNLTRNVVEAHLRVIFGFYGEVVKIDLPMYAKCAHDSAIYSAPLFLSTPPFFFLKYSWPKQRKSRSGICRRILCPHRRLAHERRAARRRRAKSRAIRHAPLPPHPFPFPPAATPTAPATKRARPRPRTPFSFAPAFTLAPTAAALPAQGAGLQQQPHLHRRLVPPRAARARSAQQAAATAAGCLSAALAYAFSVADTQAWWCVGYEEEVTQL